MDRIVSVLRSKRTGVFLANPMGTYKGYGAFVGLYPYRELPSEAEPTRLGEVLVELLKLSGPTGVPFRDAKKHQESVLDPETARIRQTYLAAYTSTAKLARSFLRAQVKRSDHQKSWVVTAFGFDRARKALVGGKDPKRVSVSAGPRALGQALLQALDLG